MEKISKNQVKFVRTLARKKERDATSMFVAEGEKCVGELMKTFELVLRADATNATSLELEQMSSLRSPQGVVAVFRKPQDTMPPMPAVAANELVLVLDGVQDPGNVGTIIRTADWFGIRHIYCSPDTADCWSPKVVQATMGALARVHVHYCNLFEQCRLVAEQGSTVLKHGSLVSEQGSARGESGSVVPVYGTLLDGRNLYDSGAVPNKRNGLIVMGNEGKGISPEMRSLITHPLLIPPYPLHADTSESLNVGIATAVILAEFRRPQ